MNNPNGKHNTSQVMGPAVPLLLAIGAVGAGIAVYNQNKEDIDNFVKEKTEEVTTTATNIFEDIKYGISMAMARRQSREKSTHGAAAGQYEFDLNQAQQDEQYDEESFSEKKNVFDDPDIQPINEFDEFNSNKKNADFEEAGISSSLNRFSGADEHFLQNSWSVVDDDDFKSDNNSESTGSSSSDDGKLNQRHRANHVMKN